MDLLASVIVVVVFLMTIRDSTATVVIVVRLVYKCNEPSSQPLDLLYELQDQLHLATPDST